LKSSSAGRKQDSLLTGLGKGECGVSEESVYGFSYLNGEERCCGEVLSNFEEGARPMWCVQPSIEERRIKNLTTALRHLGLIKPLEIDVRTSLGNPNG